MMKAAKRKMKQIKQMEINNRKINLYCYIQNRVDQKDLQIGKKLISTTITQSREIHIPNKDLP